MYQSTSSALKQKIEILAEKAFRQHLISGYGDSEFPNQYQIVYQGKPRHFSLDHAFAFLKTLVDFNLATAESLMVHKK
ncbi:hypothetical protein [Thermocoleostomius sinensis]|uniref:Uncharacterized protein n=1 Tax=Thermocoleostomius sinensis A174 TaxID=2016057 RepID=A0A9E8ZF95_9CYAN|nr:hypothetical protein [Thermocoleostomius sinensis]WAL62290.1 hypothetical protein OXH18_09960 [Thermocoleostomius sinensis A174]